MPKYVKLHNEYLNFLSTAKDEISDPYEARILNLISNNFDEVAERGIPQGARAEYLNQLIQKNGSKASETISQDSRSARSKSFPIKSLKSIRLSHFRGFSFDDPIDLGFEKKLIFVYGPNGSGKSSLCEALEYSLLGYINESINRRIEISTYIKNKFSNKASQPILSYHHIDGHEDQIKPNPDLYQFCFIEKNRIENFARISSSTPKDKQSRIAALFGLTEFNDFVKNFTPNFENKIDIVGKFGALLTSKSQAVGVHAKNIETAKTAISERNQKVLDVLSGIGFKGTYEEWKLSALGENGEIKKLESELGKPSLQLVKVPDIDLLAGLTNQVAAKIAEIKENIRNYFGSRNKINFRDLYQAIKSLENEIQQECPACRTPLDKVVTHPVTHAEAQLRELTIIFETEKKIRSGFKSLEPHYISVLNDLATLVVASKELGTEVEFTAPKIISTSEINLIDSFLSDAEQFLRAFEDKRKKIGEVITLSTDRNRLVEKQIQHRSEITQKREDLLSTERKIKVILGEVEQHNTNIKNWAKEVDAFNKENESLIKSAEAEKILVSENVKYLSGYNSFLSRIKSYMEALPSLFLEDLNALTTELYNEINKHDMEYEKANKIELPKTAEESIYISFKNAPTKKLDALDVLSEGHIKCLGLAILLAKNIHETCPIVVFDDIINAIDDDHRGGIRELLLSSSRFTEKQMLLTTHSTQFMRELAQHHTVSNHVTTVLEYNFSALGKSRGISVTNSGTDNYLAKADQMYAKAKWPDVLSSCRQALENLANKLWKKFGNKKYKAELQVVLRAPGGKPDLKSVIDAQVKLMKGIKAAEFTKIAEGFEFFSGGAPECVIRWSYLNSGTHEEEERSEFDQNIVNAILAKLKEIDENIKTL